MSSAAAPVPTRPSAGVAALSLPSRLVASFSGTVGLTVKIVLLGLANALAAWAAVVLADKHRWPALGALVAATLAIDVVYLARRRTVPLKFLVPGTIFLLAFQVAPILYTVDVAFTNYSTGHILTKGEAIQGVLGNSLAAPANGQTYAMAPARDDHGKLVLVLVADNGGTFVGTQDGLKPVPRGSVKVTPDGAIASAPPGYKLVKGNELFSLDRQLGAYTVPTHGSSAIRPEGLDTAVDLAPTLRYDSKRDAFVRIDNPAKVYRDNGRGSFAAANGDELEPGWRTGVGFRNFSSLIHNPLVRAPFLRVFAWTFAFAALTVLFSFALGLFLAITLDKRGMRFQRLYRSALVIPYAVPGALSLLVWAGLLNDDFGVVNRLLHVHVAWLFGANWAKVSVILVSLWLTFPYFFLVSMGALQSIPTELVEAARVDGGGRWQVFRRVTLPLLLVAVAPLLIASFAFNFNNFNSIYLLTGGGPASNDQSIAGATDILISYTYKLSFATGKGGNYALAAAVSILIFFIVAGISAVSFWRSKSLENLR